MYDDPDYQTNLDNETIERLNLEELDYIAGDNMFEALMDRVRMRDKLIEYINLLDELAYMKIVDIQKHIDANNSQIINLEKEANITGTTIYKQGEQIKQQYGGDIFVTMNYSPVYEIQRRINILKFENDFLIACNELIPK